jgi:hypothetical protein
MLSSWAFYQVIGMETTSCWHAFRKMFLSLMARLEYAVMEKQGQCKIRRDSAEVHEECKSVLAYLMANRQVRKTNNARIIA